MTNFDYKQNLINLMRQFGVSSEEIAKVQNMSNEDCKKIIKQINNKLDEIKTW